MEINRKGKILVNQLEVRSNLYWLFTLWQLIIFGDISVIIDDIQSVTIQNDAQYPVSYITT